MKYRKKPIEVEAMRVPKRWRGNDLPLDLAKLVVWLGAGGPWKMGTNGEIEIKTLEGVMLANPGDWIIKGVKGEFYPCKPDIFEATYDAV